MLKRAGKAFYKNECDRFDTDVLILIDHINREMQFAALLTQQLNRRGLKTEVVTTKYNLYRIPIIYRAFILITPWVYTNREADILYKIRRPDNKGNATIINLHCEQIAGQASDKFLLPRDRATECQHISWSTPFTKKLISAKVAKEDILELGNPKLDHYRDFNKCASPKTVLIVGNAFHLLTQEEKARFKTNGINIEGIGKSGLKNYEELTSNLPSILDSNPDLQFIYRPHPSFATRDIKNRTLLKLAENHANFRMEHTGAISDAMSNALLLISFHSTSYLESAMLDIPFAILRFSNVHASDDIQDLANWPLVIDSRESFQEVLNKSKNNTTSLRGKYSQLREKYYMNSKTSVSQRLSDHIIRSLENNPSTAFQNNKSSFTIRNYLLFCFKLATNILSVKSKTARNLLLSSEDYRIQNLAYMWGDDAFDKQFFQ